MEGLRNLKRTQFATELRLAQNLPIYSKCMQDLGLQDFQIQIPSKMHCSELLQILSYSMAKNNPLNRIFRITATQNEKDWKPKVNTIIESGTYLILIHKHTKQIIGGIGFMDLCEIYKTPKYSLKIMQIVQKPKNAFFDNNRNNPKYKDLYKIIQIKKSMATGINNKQQTIKLLSKYYGKWCESTLFFMHPQYEQKGYAKFLKIILQHIIKRLSYSKIYGAHNPRTLNGIIGAAHVKFIDVIFDDGTTMYEYFHQLKTKWNFDETEVEKYKKLSYHFVIDSIENHKNISMWKDVLHLFNVNTLRKKSKL